MPQSGRFKRRALVAAAVAVALAATVMPARAQSEITIIRDAFGVPHVYADTAEDVSYGAGYVLAQDRLWQMHTFRKIAKGELTDLLTNVPDLAGAGLADTDRTVRFFTYTAEERARRFEAWPEDLRMMLTAFVEGVNAWIAEVRANPTLLPFEFVEFAVPLEDWAVDDSIALSDVLILAFGSGGGNELSYAGLLDSLVDAQGEEAGLAMFDDLILTEDPDGPMTVPPDLDYVANDDKVRDADANARRVLTEDARISLEPAPEASAAAASATTTPAVGTAAQLDLIPDVDAALEGYRRIQRGLKGLRRMFRFGSNAQIVGPQLSAFDNSLQTGGPQVGYLLPQWLADFGLHSADGRLDATGMTFAGAGPAVLIGRGKGYAWTTTTGSSDLTDTYVETLNPENPREYEFNGAFEPMECRTETLTSRGIPYEEFEVCRTRHGPVMSFDEENDVAYSLRYAWFNREQQTVEGFFRYNQATSIEDYATFANFLASNHNMFYVDDQGNYGFWHPGNHPVRAEGIDIRLPQDGTGGSEWQGLLPIQEVPHAVNFDRGWLVNWNNQPALGWERERGHPALDNAIDLARTMDPTLDAAPDPLPDLGPEADGGLVNPDRNEFTFEDLNGNLRYAAFKHHNDTYFRPFLPEDDALETQLAMDAAAVVRDWDGFNTDRDNDGMEDSAGRRIIDTWRSIMRTEAFNDDLGDLAGFANDSLTWHLLAPNDTLQLGHDWLNGEDVVAFAARTFEAAVAALAAEGGGDPAAWAGPIGLQHYQRLNADLIADTALGALGQDTSGDSGLPGDVPDHIRMDRGTYNHIVVYTDPFSGSGDLGESAGEAGSVIPPGQSGHVDILGQEAPHYEDQLALYVGWTYKPMPMTLAEAQEVAESDVVLSRP